ncbi:MAG: LarC family nickel insertion protein, partial [Gemmatimonadales bacterium]
MKIAVVDPSAGASGDMFLGALLACGLDPNWIQGLPTRLGFGEVGVRISDVARCSVASKKIDFEFPGGQPEGDRHHGDHAHGHHVGDLIARIRGANLTDWVKDTAVAAFELLGEAEGQVHGVAPHDVHLHEVGAIDAVLEIVGVVEGFEQFGVDRIYNMPAAIGNGWVKATHGMLPVPAPATALLLEGVDIVSGGPVFGEATTPTGAVLLRVLSSGAPPPRWRPVKSGWGAGTRDPESYPNALRLIVAETVAE